MNSQHQIKIGLIHALEESEMPIRESFQKIWPEVNLNEYADFQLSIDRANGLDETAIRSRIIDLGQQAVNDHVDAILYTCSAFGDAIEAAKNQFNLPILKPNEPAFKNAINAALDVNILVTFEPSLKLLINEFEMMSRDADINIKGHLIHDALKLLKENQVKAHNDKIISAVEMIPSHETIILGQFSMARAAEEIKQQMPDRLVLNTPDAAVTELKELLSG
jgi:Asp/Glu/hydantoin racemase